MFLYCSGISSGFDKIVEVLLANESPIDDKDDCGMTPFLTAAREGNCSLATLLMKHGADVTKQDVHLKTALHFAVQNGCRKLAALLITQKKMLIRVKDENNQTPLHYAAKHGHTEVSKFQLVNTFYKVRPLACTQC